MAQFFLTWLSYFIICFVLCAIGLALWSKSVNPFFILYINFWFGGVPLMAVIVLSLLFACVSRFDPLGWLWADVAQFAAENPCPLGCGR